MEKHQLSKSTFIRGEQCLKSLYLYKNRYFLRDALSAEQRAKFVRGIDVGVLAQSLFTGGINCQPASPSGYQKSVLKTSETIQNGIAEVIYEAAFQHDRVLILLDILAKANGQWNAYEIKSSRSISETFILDAALQYYVLKNSGIEINRFFLVHLNGDYEFTGSLDLKEVFTFVDVTDKIDELQDFVIKKIEEEKTAIALKNSPKIEIGLHCNRPYPCDFIGHCWKNVPANSVFRLSTFSDEEKFGFYNQGIQTPDDFSEELLAVFDHRKRIEIKAIKENKPFFDKEKLAGLIENVTEKSGFFWFLGQRPAIPAFEKHRPYDVVPVGAGFQLIENGTPKRAFWFNENPYETPDEKFFDFIEKQVFSLDKLLVYEAESFIGYLRRFTERKPETSAQVEAIISKISDLSAAFSEMYFFHPALKGNFDLANVAEKLLHPDFPNASTIKSEVLVTNNYLKYQASTNDFEKTTLADSILDYCRFHLDCLDGFYGFLNKNL